MKKTILTLALTLPVLFAKAQNNSLILPPNYIPDINNSFPVPLPSPATYTNEIYTTPQTNDPTDPFDAYDGQPSYGASNAIFNEAGKPIFFVVDGIIYNEKGEGSGICAGYNINAILYEENVYGSAETVIVPNPGNCNQYYIINHEGYESNGTGFIDSRPTATLYDTKCEKVIGNKVWFSISTNSQNGLWNFPEITGSDLGNWTDHYGFGSIGATKQQLDGSFYVVAFSNILLTVAKIDANGIHKHFKYVLPTGPGHNNQRRVLEIYEDPITHEKVIVTSHTPATTVSSDIITITRMNSTMDAVISTNSIIIPSDDSVLPHIYANVRGLEFSPNGQYIYVTHTPNIHLPGEFGYINVNNPTQITPLTVPSGLDFRFSEIESFKDVYNNDYMLLAEPDGIYKYSLPLIPGSGTFSQLSSVMIDPNYSSNFPGGQQTNATRFYLLNDKIDDFAYADYFEETPECCLNYKAYNAYEKYEADLTSTWEDNASGANPVTDQVGNELYFKEDLVIKAGTTITIKNMLLHFTRGSRLIIENGTNGSQGGKLILDNTTLTSDERCEDNILWLGVEVWGNNNQAQGSVFNSTQGRIVMQNGAKIENAVIGALISRRGENVSENPPCPDEMTLTSNYQNQYNGGIIQTTDSWFLNCPTSVKFLPYTNNNISQFRRTGFRWNDILGDNATPISHVEMTQIKPVSFYGCQFNNDVASQYSMLDHGYGIKALSSQFYVGRDCTTPGLGGQLCPGTQSYFRNLFIGIYSADFTSTRTFKCDGNEFINNVYGVYVQNVKSEQVTRNLFKVRESDIYFTAGLVMYNSSGYKVEENEFFEYDDLTVTDGTALSYGIVVNNSGTKYNEIYNNKFHNLKIGGQSEKVNAVQMTSTNNTGTNGFNMNGLKWLCNDFISDIVDADMTVISGRINFHQGGLSNYSTYLNAKRAAARNRFSLTGEPFANQHDVKLMNNSQQINYYWIAAPRHEPDSYTTSGGLAYTQVVNPDEIEFNNKSILEDQNACPSQLVMKPKSVLKSELLVIEQDLENIDRLYKEDNYNNYLDLIETSANPSELSDALLNAAPYLTDAVLITYIQSGAPAGHIKAVLMAHSPLSESVLQALSESNLPQGTLNQIATVQQGINPRLLLLYTRHYLVGEYDKITDEIIRQYLTDNDFNGDYEGLKLFLNERPNDIKRKEVLLETHITKGEYAEAEMVKSELIQLNEDPEYLEISEIEKNIHPSPSAGEEINNDPQLKAQIENIAGSQNSIHASGKAKGLLKMADGVGYIPNFLIGNSSMSLLPTEGAESSEKPELFKELTVSMYPNPSNGMVYFDLPEQEEGEMAIQLFDLSGKMVHAITFTNTNGELVDFSSVNKGTYIVKISLSNGFSEAQLLQLK